MVLAFQFRYLKNIFAETYIKVDFEGIFLFKHTKIHWDDIVGCTIIHGWSEEIPQLIIKHRQNGQINEIWFSLEKLDGDYRYDLEKQITVYSKGRFY